MRRTRLVAESRGIRKTADTDADESQRETAAGETQMMEYEIHKQHAADVRREVAAARRGRRAERRAKKGGKGGGPAAEQGAGSGRAYVRAA
jgi:hypothetical protein